MKTKLRTSFKKYEPEIKFILIIMLFGIITGAIFYLKQDDTIKASLTLDAINPFSNNVFNFQNIIMHLVILLFLTLSSFLGIGLIFTIIYIFIEGLAVGFLIPLFLNSYKLSGIWTISVYFIFIKLLFFILLIAFFIFLLKLVKRLLLSLKNRNLNFKSALKNVILIISFIFLNDLIIFFVGNKIVTFILV